MKDGLLYPQVQICPRVREEILDQISLLACVGLQRDSVVVEFTGLFEKHSSCDAIKQNLTELEAKSRIGRELATTLGARLGLVEPYGDGIRFPHSIMQAYLGSRKMGIALGNENNKNGEKCSSYMEGAMYGFAGEEESLTCGNEFLLALAMYGYAHAGESRTRGEGDGGEKVREQLNNWIDLLDYARFEKAKSRSDPGKVLEVFIRALEIDSELGGERFADLAQSLLDWLTGPRDGEEKDSSVDQEKLLSDRWTVGQGKLRLVRALTDAVHNMEELANRQFDQQSADWAARGGRTAIIEEAGDRTFRTAIDAGYRTLLTIAEKEPSHAIRLAAIQELADSKAAGIETLRKEWFIIGEKGRGTGDGAWRDVAAAWLLPMLLGSASGLCGQHVQEDGKTPSHLEKLQEYLWALMEDSFGDGSGNSDEPPLTTQIALAQGFKYAANRRHRHPCSSAECESYLVPRATELLSRSDFWFTQLTLIQALCLWHMPDRDSHDARRDPLSYSEARHKVNKWLVMAGSQHADAGGRKAQHPFVSAAADLAVLALEHQAPERYLWIDESGVVSQVGSEAQQLGRMNRMHRLWIPPSAGWSMLDPRARKLVADVLLLLNLADRGENPRSADLPRRMAQTKGTELPSCLRRNRDPLDPCHPATTERLVLGVEHCAPDCPVQLCPYPPKSGAAHQAEMNEAFCRKQRELVGKHRFLNFRQTMGWQGASVSNMREFWETMEDRAQGRRGHRS